MENLLMADDLELHAVDFSQAFIQADWKDLPEKTPQIFIRPPQGWPEEEGVVYEVLRPLYGIPSSARALHFTLDRWMTDNLFVPSNFEESVWQRPADDIFPHNITISAHIDDTPAHPV